MLEAEKHRKDIEAAEVELAELCEGKRWRMCIPVQPTDSDIVIANALMSAKMLLAALEAA